MRVTDSIFRDNSVPPFLFLLLPFLSADVLSNMSGKYAGVGFYFTHINYISL